MGLRLRNGWTGGQYSVLRALVALVVLLWLAVAGSAPGPARALEALLATALALGWHDRAAAMVLATLLAAGAVLARDAAAGVLTLVVALHAAVPAAPYGSLAAAGRVDPGGGWRRPQPEFAATWIALVLAWVARGIAGLPAPWATASVALAPLALVAPLRPWLWAAGVLTQLAWLAAGDGLLPAVMLALHGAAFDPGWIPAPRDRPERLFYDGACGLCHRVVRFALAEDPTGRSLRFAPLGGDTFRRDVAHDAEGALPDSLVLQTNAGELLVRSGAVLRLLDDLGGGWRVVAAAGGLVPRALGDRLYDRIAAARHRLFARPPAACPTLPPALRARFDG